MISTLAKAPVGQRLQRGLRILKAALKITDVARWRKNARTQPGWDGRNKRVAALIPAESRVIDIGSGAQTLKRYLPPGCSYTPCDLVRSSPDCIVCNFNHGEFPPTHAPWDVAVCSGVLEYINDSDSFLRKLRACATHAILSYEPAAGPHADRLPRLRHGWVNHLTRDDLERKLRYAGFKVSGRTRWEQQLIYTLA